MTDSILTPALALIAWTLIVWVWMYATRIPAMKKNKVDPQSAIHPGALNVLPEDARVVADNYNHLHEQPVVFYALVFYTHLASVADGFTIWLAWGCVALRIIHSITQIIVRKVMVRFSVFVLSGVLLIILALRNVIVLFS